MASKVRFATLGPWARHPLVRVGASGAIPEVATTLSEQFRDEGVRALISWGIAGGLGQSFTPGTLVLPANVIDERSGAVFDVNGHIPMTPKVKGALVGCEAMAEGGAAKRDLTARFGADAVDMESHRVARVAARSGLACHVVRAIADSRRLYLP